MLPHERLEVYWLMDEYVAYLDYLKPRIERASREDGEQLDGAAGSILYNLCEGTADIPPKERIKFFRYSRRSISETNGILRRHLRKNVITEQEYRIGYYYADRGSAMIWNLIKAQNP